MWTCSLLKQNAKLALSATYWRAFALCLLLTIVGVGSYSTNVTYYFEQGIDRIDTTLHGQVWTGNVQQGITLNDLWRCHHRRGLILAGDPPHFHRHRHGVGLLVTGPLTVGRNRYFMENRQSPAPLRTATTVFRTPYLNVVKVSFLVTLKTFLGFFLFLIPGIYWSYCYLMSPTCWRKIPI